MAVYWHSSRMTMFKKHTQFQLVFFCGININDDIIYMMPTGPVPGAVDVVFFVFSVINGLAFIATGGLGVFSAQKPSRCTIKALMALYIISACLTVARLSFDILIMINANKHE